MQEQESLIYDVLALGMAGLAGLNLQESQATPGFARLSGVVQTETRFVASMNSQTSWKYKVNIDVQHLAGHLATFPHHRHYCCCQAES